MVVENNSNTGISILSGTSSTGSIYFGDSDRNWDGYIAYSHGTSPTMTIASNGGGNYIKLDSTGSVGFSSTPTSWSSGYKSIQIGDRGFVGAHTGSDLYVGQNAYFDSAWKYEASSAASMTQHSGGQITHKVAAAGTANNAITWANAFHITSTGNVGVNETSPQNTFHVEGQTRLAKTATNSHALNAATALEIRGDSIGSGVVDVDYFKGFKIAINDQTEWGSQAQFSVGRWEENGNNSRSSLVISLGHAQINSSSNADVDVMTMRSDGNVGIGSSTPTARLTVTQNSAAKIARFTTTQSQGITVGSTDADNAGRGVHLAHDNSSTGYLHAYNYGSAGYDPLQLRGSRVDTVGGTGHNVFRACSNGLFSIGAATYTQGRIRQYVYTASVSNGTTVDLFYNTGAYDDLHLIATIEATHSSRTYRYRAGPFGYYQTLPTLNAGVGLDFTSATVNTGRRMLQFLNNSGYTAATYISILIIGDNGVTVSNGAISDLL